MAELSDFPAHSPKEHPAAYFATEGLADCTQDCYYCSRGTRRYLDRLVYSPHRHRMDRVPQQHAAAAAAAAAAAQKENAEEH